MSTQPDWTTILTQMMPVISMVLTFVLMMVMIRELRGVL